MINPSRMVSLTLNRNSDNVISSITVRHEDGSTMVYAGADMIEVGKALRERWTHHLKNHEPSTADSEPLTRG